MRIFCGHRGRYVTWFRIFGFGLSFTKAAALFGERQGYKKRLRLPFGWRVEILNRQNRRLRPGDKVTGEAGEKR